VTELGTVLIADDNRDDALLVRRALEAAGVPNPIKVVSSGKEALDFLERCIADGSPTKAPVLVLLDVQMPDLGGLEVLYWLSRHRALRTGLRVVMLASSGSLHEREAARQLGADACIEKPLNFQALEQEMKRLKELWLKSPTD
jgi:CheY-like chemotaxis protein